MQFVWSFKANREQRVRIECAANRVPIELVFSLIFCKSDSNAYRPDRKRHCILHSRFLIPLTIF